MPRAAEARVPARLVGQVVDAARAALPNEAVGLLVGRATFGADGSPERYVPLVNSAASPYRYTIDAQEQLRIWMELEDAGEVVWAIVHSHVGSAAVPSATDIELAYFPDSLCLICSLAGDVPDVRAWSIREGVVGEIPVAVAS